LAAMGLLALAAQSAPAQINQPKIVQVAAGDRHVLALREDGSVVSWGENEDGQLGDRTTDYRNAAAPVPGLSDIVQVSAKATTSLALRSDGTVWEWGEPFPAASGPAGPEQIPGLVGMKRIAA